MTASSKTNFEFPDALEQHRHIFEMMEEDGQLEDISIYLSHVQEWIKKEIKGK